MTDSDVRRLDSLMRLSMSIDRLTRALTDAPPKEKPDDQFKVKESTRNVG